MVPITYLWCEHVELKGERKVDGTMNGNLSLTKGQEYEAKEILESGSLLRLWLIFGMLHSAFQAKDVAMRLVESWNH